jgi:hypothetical protein
MKFQHLKDIAAKLNITYRGNVGSIKLEQMIRDYCEENNLSFDEIVQETEMDTEDSIITFDELENQNKNKNAVNVQHEALRLVRCIITCNNKNKTSYTGEIFSASNAVIPEVKKFVQFGSPTHIPVILLNMIKEKKVQVYSKKRQQNGDMITVANEVPEYNIQLLDPLTGKELEAIKQKQLAEGYNGE